MIINNKNNNNLVDVLKEKIQKDCKLSIITSFFTLYGFDQLKKELKNSKITRILTTQNYFATNLNQLASSQAEKRLKNQLTQEKIAKECYEWVDKKVEIREAREEAIGFELYHLENQSSSFAVSGSSPFSADGMGAIYSSRSYMNMGIDDESSTKKLLTTFDEFWHSDQMATDIKSQILANLDFIAKDKSPQFIYFLTLYNIFKDFLDDIDEEKIIKQKTGFKDTAIWNTLYGFQKDGVLGAIDKLEKHGGCIIADSVGLGKTYEALAVIKYYELRNDRVLVLCPKKLRENWTIYTINDKRNILSSDRFGYDVLNHTDLTRESGYSGEINLATLNWENYDLIVIDESHNFRNTSTNKNKNRSRYEKLLVDILQKGVKTRVLMLSATPVNNRLNDLKNQLQFITEGEDDHFSSYGVSSVENTLKTAQRKFNRWLEYEEEERTTKSLLDDLNFDYFKLLDLVTIARSRKHIEKYYKSNDVGKFPNRLSPINIKSDIDSAGIFPPLSEINNTIRKMNLCAYSPLRYVLPEHRKEYEKRYDTITKSGSTFSQLDRENSIISLMRINLLKRMESSINSFASTVSRILEKNRQLLSQIENHTADQLEEMSIDEIDIDDDRYADMFMGSSIKVLINDIDKIRWTQDIKSDIEKLESLLYHSEQIDSSRDKKLQELKKLIENKVKNPINDNSRKIIIFTAFADTAEYLYENISTWAKSLELESVLISGSGTNRSTLFGKEKDLNMLLTHFSPRSKERHKVSPDETKELDILIATDCISEGQNLQDCDYLINYDIHWNPVRIIQRFGRIDRLGSKNEQIQLVNFWANIELEEYINLESRVSGKMVLLDVSATGEENIIDTSNKSMNDLSYRAKQLRELQNQVVDIEDINGGVAITDLTLNDFKMDLSGYMKNHADQLENSPTGFYSIVRTDGETKQGTIFCIKLLEDTKNDKYSLEPYYLVFVGSNGEIVLEYTNAKIVLDQMKKLSLGKDMPDSKLADQFRVETKNQKDMSFYTDQLSSAVESILGKKAEQDIASIFERGNILSKSTASSSYEIISYLVIK